MVVSFKQFLNIIDMEIQQTDKGNIVSIKDKGRKAVASQIIKWTNGALNFLASVNPNLWYREETYVVPADAEYIELPFYWKRLDMIVTGNYKYKVSPTSDSTSEFYARSYNEIARRGGTFTAGEELTFSGTFHPTMLSDPLREDFAQGDSGEALYYAEIEKVKNEYVDIDQSYIDLLKLKVLLSYSARQGNSTSAPYWASDFRQQLEIFKNASPPVMKHGTISGNIAWGQF